MEISTDVSDVTNQPLQDDERITNDNDEHLQQSQLPVANPKKFVYLCSICRKIFSSKNNLSDHMEKVHKRRVRLRLVNFNKPLADDEHLQQSQLPIANLSKKFVYFCSICHKIFSTRNNLSDHLNEEHGLRVVDSNNDDENLQQSQLPVGSPPETSKYFCNICDKGFSNKSNLNRHTKNVHNQHLESNEALADDECSQESQLPVTDPSEKSVYFCSICDKIFSNKSNLNRHTKNVHSQHLDLNKPLTDDEYSQESELPIVNPSEKTLYFCNTCDKKFYTVTSLNYHTKVHNIPLADEHIQQSESSQVLVVSGSERIVHFCNICCKTFFDRSTLNRHTKKIHKEYFVLNKVDDECSQESQSPEANSLEKSIYFCSICDKIFYNRPNLNRHTKIVHNQHLNLNKPTTDDEYSQESELQIANPTKKRVHLCNVCGKTYFDKSTLNRHTKRVHNENSDSNKSENNVSQQSQLSVADTSKKNVHICNICNKTYFDKSTLNRHTKKVHNDLNKFKSKMCSQRSQLPVTNRLKKHFCNICGKTFCDRSNLNRHTKKLHNQHINLSKAKPKVCPLCRINVTGYKELDEHFLSVHNINIEHSTLEFKNEDEFLRWKFDIEKETKCFYKFSHFYRRQGKKWKYYECHRSGLYQTRTKGPVRKRALKVRGSIKINSHCPARLRVQVDYKKGCVLVDHVSQHVGHELDIRLLRLNHVDSQYLASKILQGIPPHRILKDLNDNFNAESRISFTTKQDLINIRKALKAKPACKLHPDDAANVDILIRKYQDLPNNPFLYYKPFGIEDPDMGKNNFVLIFMDSAQEDLLLRYGNDVFVIDAMRGTNPYNIQLTTLMVIDDDLEVFPVAFLWSMTQTELVFQIFFLCLKQRVPDVTPQFFMSYDSDELYNGFMSVYGSPETQKLLCDWHVKKNIRSSVSRIKNSHKQKRVKSSVMKLMNELDEQTFYVMLEQVLEEWSNDPDILDYYNYFINTYSNRLAQWAHCYKKNIIFYNKILNTNLALESWHKDIKHNSTTENMLQQTLDSAINIVLDCLRQRFFKLLMNMSHDQVIHRLSDLRTRHKVAEQLKDDLQIFEGVHGKKWQVASAKNCYEVIRDESFAECPCQIRCSECSTCLHEYSCSCDDYLITYNMCKHIHLVCMRPSMEVTCTSPMLTLEETMEDLDQKTDHNYFRKNAELDEQKLQALEKSKLLMNAIESSQSLEAVTYVIQNLTSTLSVFNALDFRDINPT